MYHSHIDVHPPVAGDVPFRYEWHQDGGWQNHELETDPRPRLSVKAGYWLSDVSQAGRGNLKLVPGSHTVNRIDGPPRRDVPWPDPPGAAQVTARPGDVVLFDRRVWHARSVNRSNLTRKAVLGRACLFLGRKWLTSNQIGPRNCELRPPPWLNT